MQAIGELFTVTRQVTPLNCVPGAKSAVVDCLVVAVMTQEFHNSLRLNSSVNNLAQRANNESRRHHLAHSSSAAAAARTTQPAARAARPPTATATGRHSTGADLASSHVTVSNHQHVQP